MANFTGTLRLEVETARSDVFVWGVSSWSGYRFGGPADTATSGTEWLNVLGETHEIKVRRGGKLDGIATDIEAGALTATVLDPSVDPSSSPYIKPGTPIRLMHGTEPVFTGELRQIKVTYHGGQPRVFLSATDRVRDLVNTMRYGAYTTVTLEDRVADLLTKHAVPYEMHGTSEEYIFTNRYESTLLNHLTLATRSAKGHWYVDKANKVRVYGESESMRPKVYTFTCHDSTTATEIEYVDIAVSYDTADLVNEVVFNNITEDLNEEGEWASIHTKHGPFSDPTSVATYGSYADEVDISIATSRMADFADEILALSSRPEIRVSDIRVNYSENPSDAAALDIYDTIGAEYENENIHIGNDFAVIALEHEISASNTDHKWMTTLELHKLGGI